MLGVSDNYVTPLEVVVCVNRVEDSRGGSLGCGSNLEVLLSSYPESNRFIFVVYQFNCSKLLKDLECAVLDVRIWQVSHRAVRVKVIW